MKSKDFKGLMPKSVNKKAKDFLDEKYGIYFDSTNHNYFDGKTTQIKVITILDHAFNDLKSQNLSKRLNQIYIEYFDYILVMLVFKDQFVFCKVPHTYLRSLTLSPQHNKECFQTSVIINEIINNFKIDPDDFFTKKTA